jgi:hypothetical protein
MEGLSLPKYKLSVGALFKNESHSIKEWIEHYLIRGVDHFYLIDDSSTDNYLMEIQEYIDKGIISLFIANWDRYLGRQKDMYNHYILPKLKETEWLLMVDLDEYMWSPRDLKLTFVLNQAKHIGQMQVEHTIYGSNGYIEQPKKIVESFIRRSHEHPTQVPGNRKYFVNSLFEFSSLNPHHATFVSKEDEEKHFILLDKTYYILNHYNCQSKEFWLNVKCKRGDSDEYRERTEEDFKAVDLNDIEDTELIKQNS